MIPLLICFVSLLFVSFRMVSLPIDFVSHPKIPFSLRSETGGSVSLFCEKKVSLCFASVSLRSEIWGHPTSILYIHYLWTISGPQLCTKYEPKPLEAA